MLQKKCCVLGHATIGTECRGVWKMRKMDKFSGALRLAQYTMRCIADEKHPFSLSSMTQKDVYAT
jgi:hypothetical protein